MKFIFSILFISVSQICYSQIIFEEVLTFEEKSFREIKASLIAQYTIIKDGKEYSYYPLKKCSPPEYANDSCQWKCIMPDYLDEVKSKYPLDRVIFKKSSNKNYGISLVQNSNFAENYNPNTKKATTFIYLRENKEWRNSNCRNEMEEIESRINIDIQLADQFDWRNFKNSITTNATFHSTWQSSNDSPIHLRYSIKRYQTETGYWKGIFIDMYEGITTFHVSIRFDTLIFGGGE
jgi:hypothetical protein